MWSHIPNMNKLMVLMNIRLNRGDTKQYLSIKSHQFGSAKVSKGAKIRKRYNQVPHLAQDINGKVTNSQIYTTNESQEVSPFPAADHKAQINRCAQRQNKHKKEKT